MSCIQGSSLLMFPKASRYTWGTFFWPIPVPLVASGLYCHLQSQSWTFSIPLGLFCVLGQSQTLGSPKKSHLYGCGQQCWVVGCVYQIFLPHVVAIMQQSTYNNMTVIFDKQGVTRFFLLCHKVFFIWEGWSFCQVHVTAACLPGALNQVEDIEVLRAVRPRAGHLVWHF